MTDAEFMADIHSRLDELRLAMIYHQPDGFLAGKDLAMYEWLRAITTVEQSLYSIRIAETHEKGWRCI